MKMTYLKHSSVDSDIIIYANEIKGLGKEYTTIYDYQNGKTLIIEGLEFKQDNRLKIDNNEYLVWAVLEDKIILKLIAKPL
ncbi:MAG TPA: hypothetical protein DCQ50_17315 [Chryseobacterium sp.]|nr:hypothetical protein [Chryseobacterium sp.]